MEVLRKQYVEIVPRGHGRSIRSITAFKAAGVDSRVGFTDHLDFISILTMARYLYADVRICGWADMQI